MNGYNNILAATEIPWAAPANLGAKSKSGTIRIWMVDDNSVFRSLLASILNDESGFECSRQFSSPDAVLKALEREDAPDIILLDIEMGEHNGLDAIHPIKAIAKGTHVLMLTTFASPECRERAFREGASDFMLKTWPIPEIVMHIRQAMEFGSVAGLLTAFLGQGRGTETRQSEATGMPSKSNATGRWLVYLRDLLKFSPS